MAAKYDLKKSADGQFFFHLKAANGEVILSSEQYKSKASAEGGIESVRKNAPDDGRYDRKVATDGKRFFVLKAANGEPIGKSETYSSADAMETGIASVKKNAPDAKVDDQT